MAYASLVSLGQVLLPILIQDQDSSSLLDKHRIKCLHEHVIFLQEFFEEFPEKTDSLEGRIRNKANEAEYIIECILDEESHRSENVETLPHQAGRSGAHGHHQNFQKQYEKLKKVIKNIDSILEEVMKIKNSQKLIGDSSPATSSSIQQSDSLPHQAGRSMANRHHQNFQKQYEKLEKVIKNIKSKVEEVMRIKSSQQLIRDSSPATSLSGMQLGDSSAPSSSSMPVPIEKDSMVGFDSDLLAIKERLCGESSKLEVIPICGMGGIGKTTLARNAYEDPLSIQSFYVRAWATISQDYNIQKVLFTLLNSIKKFNKVFGEEKHRSEPMEEQLYKNLKGMKYLIVLDDMWSTEAWDDVRRLFPNDYNGSRIILTTRILDVASYANSSSLLHEMHLMDMNQSWDLLRQKVFKQENCPIELENIGRLIATSCKGLPLAIVVIAGLLSTINQTQAAWENIAKNVTIPVTANNEQFTKLLSSSYTHLPHHLRACFLYMGAFPEDYEIRVSKLIKLWVAEGFVKPSESKTFADVAKEYLEDLVKRSLVLVVKRKSNGKIKSCSLHDLMRELCIRKAWEEKFFLHIGARNVYYPLNDLMREEFRRKAWEVKFFTHTGAGNVDDTPLKSIKDQCRVSIPSRHFAILANIYSPGIRTVLSFGDFLSNEPIGLRNYLKSFKLLRVLDAVQLIFLRFPDEVLGLIHLRYFAFTYENGNKSKFYLPASISRLQNLQTLFIFPSKYSDKLSFFVCLPPEIWRMPQLQHLLFSLIKRLPNPCDGSSVLKNLQTLAMVENFKCTDRVVAMIPNLKKLGIIYRYEFNLGDDYHLENLVHLNQLEKLKICVKEYRPAYSKWGNFSFPETLKKLNLSGCTFGPANMAMIGSLSNLEVLKLDHCFFEESKWVTNEGEFAHLKFLQITFTNLMHWVIESGHFPILQRLRLGYCPRLDGIPGVIGDIPTLELIEVNNYDRSLVKSAKQIKGEQQSYGNDSLRVVILK